MFLAKKAYAALPVGGEIFINEIVLNEDKTDPVYATTFNLMMHINHGSQQYTYNELCQILQDAGFKDCSRNDAHPHYTIIRAKKLN